MQKIDELNQKNRGIFGYLEKLMQKIDELNQKNRGIFGYLEKL